MMMDSSSRASLASGRAALLGIGTHAEALAVTSTSAQASKLPTVAPRPEPLKAGVAKEPANHGPCASSEVIEEKFAARFSGFRERELIREKGAQIFSLIVSNKYLTTC